MLGRHMRRLPSPWPKIGGLYRKVDVRLPERGNNPFPMLEPILTVPHFQWQPRSVDLQTKTECVYFSFVTLKPRVE